MAQIWKFLRKLKKANLTLFVLFLLLALGKISFAQVNDGSTLNFSDSTLISGDSIEEPIIYLPDSISPEQTNVIPDSLAVENDSAAAPPPGAIKTTVTYAARDSMRVDVVKKMAYLYGDARVTYGKIELTADYMEIDLEKNEVKATYTEDSLGKPIGKPVYTDASDKFVADQIRYNFKSKRGIVSGVVTQQGEGFVHGDRVKFNEKMESFINDAQYTTCNLPHPHFSIVAKKIKLIPEKKVISGPFYMRVNDLPTPLGFAFGLFPIPKEKSSGIIVPKYGESQDRGFFLREGGYYWAVNDYMAMKFLGEIYTNGSWGLAYNNSYRKRYAYNGNFNLRYNKRITGRGEEQQEFRDFWVKWSHKPYSKGPYGGTFTADVNAGSNGYNERNSFSINEFQTPSFNSNITYSKSFRNTPLSTTITVRQNQNTQTGVMDFTLPNMNLSSRRIYPFKNIRGLKKSEFFKKFQIGPRADFQNKLTNNYTNTTSIGGVTVRNGFQENQDSINIEDNVFERLVGSANYGLKYTIPISTSVKAFKHFNFNPSVNITEYWYPRELKYGDDSAGQGIRVDTVNTFSRSGDYSVRAGLTTRVYGTFFFPKSKSVKAIRHTFIPTFSANYKPDFSETGNSHQEVVVNEDGETRRLSKYQGFINGGPSSGETGSFGWNFTNVLEMKKVNKKDSLGRTKKVKLLDNLATSGNYNFAADQFKLSKIPFNAVSKIWKLSLNLGMTLDPYTYVLDSTVGNTVYQRRIDEFAWNTNNGIGNIESYRIAISTNLNPKTFTGDNYESEEGTEEELEYINQNPDLYVDFSIPWNLRMSYNTTWTKIGFQDPSLVQNFQFGGDVKVTEKWKVEFTSALDLKAGELSTTRITIYRDLHCWQMSLSWIPISNVRASYSFDISVKANVLQDLKLNKRNSWYAR